MSQRPIDPSGPDLKVPVWFEWRGIAAKRVCSPSQLLKRVKKASAQVAEHHPTGFICVCLDNYSMRRNRGVVSAATGNRYFLKYPGLRSAVAWIKAKSPHTLSLVAFASLARWERRRDNPHMEMSSLSQITIFSKEESERERLTEFFAEVQRGFDNYWKP